MGPAASIHEFAIVLIGLRPLYSSITDWATAAGVKIKDALWVHGLRPLIATHLIMLRPIVLLACHRGD